MRAASLIYDTVVKAAIRRYLTKPVTSAAPPAQPRALKIVKGAHEYSGLDIPKIIWSYWDGPPSPCVAACRRTWDAYCADYDIRVLDKRATLDLLPQIKDLATILPVQQFSDLVRLTLLERFGGIWMDASIILTQSLEWVREAGRSHHVNFVGFYNESPREYRVDREKPLVENGFMAASPSDEFMTEWRQNYERCVRSKNYRTYYSERPDCADVAHILIDQSANALGYFSAFLAAQETFRKTNQCSMLLFNAADEFLYLHYRVHKPIRREKIAAEILMRPVCEKTMSKIVKITGNMRRPADRRIRAGEYRKDSLLGRYL